MSKKLYAIVDIETTGGQASSDKITEIAIVLHDGEKIVDSYETLIQPERSIPYYITQVTGINDEMVSNAPKFYEVAKQIVKMTEGAIFVAHNVRFDYGFIQEEFRRLGFTYVRQQLCTVKLSRKAFPGLRSYALGNLIKHFNIQVNDRHRAMADVLATVNVFERVLAKPENKEEAKLLINKGIKENHLPNDIPMEMLHKLPETCGVYYLHDKQGEVIYVGKSINIQKRIFEHFADKTIKGDKLQNIVYDISFEETGSELVALLLEDYEIKRLKPSINKAQRKTYFPYGVYSFKDEKGYVRFHAVKNVATIRKKHHFLQEFEKLSDAKSYLKGIAKRYELCEKLMEPAYTEGSINFSEKGCFYYQIGQCHGACVGVEENETYNERAELAIERMNTLFEEDFFIIDKGKNADERAVISIQNGQYYGFGYIDSGNMMAEDLLEAVKKYPKSAECNRVIRLFLNKNKGVKILKC
jgi:DNA polymerase III subunit epsilon